MVTARNFSGLKMVENGHFKVVTVTEEYILTVARGSQVSNGTGNTCKMTEDFPSGNLMITVKSYPVNEIVTGL